MSSTWTPTGILRGITRWLDGNRTKVLTTRMVFIRLAFSTFRGTTALSRWVYGLPSIPNIFIYTSKAKVVFFLLDVCFFLFEWLHVIPHVGKRERRILGHLFVSLTWVILFRRWFPPVAFSLATHGEYKSKDSITYSKLLGRNQPMRFIRCVCVLCISRLMGKKPSSTNLNCCLSLRYTFVYCRRWLFSIIKKLGDWICQWDRGGGEESCR